MMPGKNIAQNHRQLLRNPFIERLFGDKRVAGILLRQFPEQIRQAGTQRHFAAEQLHTVTRPGFQRQAVAGKPLPHFRHVILQRGAADKPLVRQILQLDGKGRGQKTQQKMLYPLRSATGDTQRARTLCLQGLITAGVVNF